MRLPTAALLLPAVSLVSADQQPLLDKLTGWFNSARGSVASAIPSIPVSNPIPNPIDAGAAAVAAKKVEKININNWQRKLAPSPSGPQELLVYVSGQNASCFGGCDTANAVWNESVALLSARPSPPRLAFLDCDRDAVLCATWAAAIPSVWHFLIPQAARGATNVPAGTAAGPTVLHIVPVNNTAAVAADFVNIVVKKSYLEQEEYTGPLHPIDGWVAKLGLNIPLGYVMWFFTTTPSWVFMIAVSFASRQFIGRRANQRVAARAPAVAAPKKD